MNLRTVAYMQIHCFARMPTPTSKSGVTHFPNINNYIHMQSCISGYAMNLNCKVDGLVSKYEVHMELLMNVSLVPRPSQMVYQRGR